VDRRRIEPIEADAAAPIHHEGQPLDVAATVALVAKVSDGRSATPAALDETTTELPGAGRPVSLRAVPL
jgi:hypothetical protein